MIRTLAFAGNVFYAKIVYVVKMISFRIFVFVDFSRYSVNSSCRTF